MRKIRSIQVEFADGKHEAYVGDGTFRLHETTVQEEIPNAKVKGAERTLPYTYVEIHMRPYTPLPSDIDAGCAPPQALGLFRIESKEPACAPEVGMHIYPLGSSGCLCGES